MAATLRLTYETSTGDDLVLNFKYFDTSTAGTVVKTFSDALITNKAIFEAPVSAITTLLKAEQYITSVTPIVTS